MDDLVYGVLGCRLLSDIILYGCVYVCVCAQVLVRVCVILLCIYFRSEGIRESRQLWTRQICENGIFQGKCDGPEMILVL